MCTVPSCSTLFTSFNVNFAISIVHLPTYTDLHVSTTPQQQQHPLFQIIIYIMSKGFDTFYSVPLTSSSFLIGDITPFK